MGDVAEKASLVLLNVWHLDFKEVCVWRGVLGRKNSRVKDCLQAHVVQGSLYHLKPLVRLSAALQAPLVWPGRNTCPLG